MPSTTCRRSLYSLPNELLSMIKAEIPESDLRTHTCFYNVSRHFAALYGSERNVERFFEKAYILSGLGILPKENHKNISWVDLATQIIIEDGFCDHPECGGSRLDANAELMSRLEFKPAVPYWSSLEIYGSSFEFEGDIKDEVSDDPPGKNRYSGSNLELNPLFKSFISFTERYTSSSGTGPYKDSLLRYPVPQNTISHLHSHPIASRSFATFPPVCTAFIYFRCDRDAVIPMNIFGVTVWDVISQIHEMIDNDLPVSALVDLLNDVKNRRHDSFRPSCDIIQTLNAIGTFRGFINYF
ncbi:hypothetical protein C8Q75DRAFT_320276 [Abortiporus biennis]|nr:hypothetical protein C8Q75DRAFT_320276 [Abortiporus biennis]